MRTFLGSGSSSNRGGFQQGDRCRRTQLEIKAYRRRRQQHGDHDRHPAAIRIRADRRAVLERGQRIFEHALAQFGLLGFEFVCTERAVVPVGLQLPELITVDQHIRLEMRHAAIRLALARQWQQDKCQTQGNHGARQNQKTCHFHFL